MSHNDMSAMLRNNVEAFFGHYFNYIKITQVNYHLYLSLSNIAWELNHFKVSRNDILKVDEIYKICKALANKNETKLVKLIQGIFDEQFSSYIRLIKDVDYVQNEARLYSEEDVRKLITNYGVLYDSELRYWSSVLYLYLIEVLKLDQCPGSVKKIINIGSSKKKKKISEVNLIFGTFKMIELLSGFNHKLRNAGSGHESWHLDDDNYLIFKDINPHTGEEREETRYSCNEYKAIYLQAKKSIFLLQSGILLYLLESSYASLKIQNKSELSLKEIEIQFKSFLNTYTAFEISKMNDKDGTISIELKEKYSYRSTHSQIISPPRQDIIGAEYKISFKKMFHSILSFLLIKLGLIRKNRLLNIYVKSLSENQICNLKSKSNLNLIEYDETLSFDEMFDGLIDCSYIIHYYRDFANIPYNSRNEFLAREREKILADSRYEGIIDLY